MKSSGFFLFGVLVGVLGAFAVERLWREWEGDDAEDLTKRVAEHLDSLEGRLENVMQAQG